MKKILFSLTLIFALLMGTMSVYAESDNIDEILAQAPDYYSKEYQKELEKTNKKIDKYLESKNKAIGEVSIKSGGTKNLSVPLYQQEVYNWCGPASAQMLLKFVQGTKYTQASLASSMGTASPNGTYVYMLTNTLNSKLGSNQYQFIKDSSYPFESSLIYGIDQNKPVVCHVETRELPHYSGHISSHYVLAIGYSWYASGSSGYSNVKYNDPNDQSIYYGTYTCDVGDMTDAINARAGYYIRCN